MKKVFTLILALSVFVIASRCDTDEVFNPDEQLAVDLRLIDDYLEQNLLVAQIDEASQIRYIINEQGDGDIAEFGSSVEVTYSGFLLDNTEFDTTEDRGALTFVLGRTNNPLVPPAWNVAFQWLPVGTSVTLFIPSGLAYGNTRGPLQNLPLNAILIYDINVLDVR